MKEPLIEALLFFKKGVKKMKANKILTSLVLTSLVAGTAMASSNNQSFNVGHYRTTLEADNSIIYGTDINVTQHNDGNVVRNIIAGGYNNLVQHDAHNSVTIGTSNNNNSANSIVSGFHNTITNADNSIAGGTQNATHSSNTLVFGNTNAIDFESDNSFAGGENVKLKGKNSFAFGEGAVVNADNVYAIGKGATANAENTIAIGNSASVTEKESIALGHNSNANTVEGTSSIAINGEVHTFAGTTPVGTVSIGDTGKERTITNVAAGRIDATSTDAINGSQLNAVINSMNFPTVVDGKNTTVAETVNINGGKEYQVNLNKDITVDSVTADKANIGGVTIDNSGINAGGKTITNVARSTDANSAATVGQLNDLQNAMNNADAATLSRANSYTDSQVAHVGASAAALSALHPLDYNPDHKTDIMAGVGHYKGKTAVALGVAYRPNENVLLSLGTTINGKDTMVNAGVSYKVGAKDSTYRSPASMAKDINDLKAIVNKLVEENKQLREQVNSK